MSPAGSIRFWLRSLVYRLDGLSFLAVGRDFLGCDRHVIVVGQLIFRSPAPLRLAGGRAVLAGHGNALLGLLAFREQDSITHVKIIQPRHLPLLHCRIEGDGFLAGAGFSLHCSFVRVTHELSTEHGLDFAFHAGLVSKFARPKPRAACALPSTDE